MKLIATTAICCALVASHDTARAEGVEHNAVARLQAKLESGEVKLAREPGRGYLDSVLRELKLPISSQSLVFSKTSLQRDHISPATPRAIYFNDGSYVGFVQGADQLEVATEDADSGLMFYTLDQRELDNPRFVQQTDTCLQCHGSSNAVTELPTLMIRSVHADPTGQPVFAAGGYRTDRRSPYEQRWGGWYVTGTHGAARHMGNVTAKNRDDETPLNLEAGANVVDLKGRFDTTVYPAATSDLVALLVLTHQAEAHNLITQAGQMARDALRDEAAMNAALGLPADHRNESTARRIEAGGEPLLRGLLFCGEAPFPAPMRGVSGFADEYERLGPFDGKGRSLRELDLDRRLLRHPCSPLIYSEAFDGLPDVMKQYIYRRLWQVLTGRDADRAFTHLTEADQRNVYDILLATKNDLPPYWKPRGLKSGG